MDTETNLLLQTTGKRPLDALSPTNNELTNNMRDLCATDAWPRFLVMESINQDIPLSRLSPFIIEKAMKGICDVVNAKKLRNGALLIEVSRCASNQSTEANNIRYDTSQSHAA